MKGDEEALDVLEKKIENLERRVYGSSFISDEKATPIIENLLGANIILNAAANGRSNIGAVFKRMEELNKHLTDEALGEPGSDIERKQNVILSLQDDYSLHCATLEKVIKLSSSLDQGNLKSIEEARTQLAALVDDYIALTSNMDDANTTSTILAMWKALVLETSRGLASANSVLTDLEAKKLGLNNLSNQD